MADNEAIPILGKFVISTEEFEATVKRVRGILGDLNADEKGRSSDATRASADAINAQKQQISNAQTLKATAAAATAQEKQKTAELKAQGVAVKDVAATAKIAADAQVASEKLKGAAAAATRVEQQKTNEQAVAASKQQISEAAAVGRAKVLAAQLEQDEIKKTASLAAAESAKRVAQIREQTAAIRLEMLQQRGITTKKENGEKGGEGGGLFRSTLGGATSAALGGGIVGEALGGALATGGAIVGLEALSKGFAELINKIREFITDSGQLQKVLDTFQRLSSAQGINAGQYMDSLFDATHRLVPQTDLLRMSNTLLQSGLKISAADVARLTEATVGLARVNGKDADQAVSALNRTFLTGRGQMLAYVTGVQKASLEVRGIGRAAGEAGKAQINLDQVLKVITARYAQLGQPALTYSDRVKQIKVTTDELFEDMAQGFVKSTGFVGFMTQLAGGVDKLASSEGLATKAGSVMGDSFGAIVTAITEVTPLVKDIAKLFKDLFDSVGLGFPKAAGDFGAFQNGILAVNDGLNTMVSLLRDALLTVTMLAKDAAAVKGNDFFGWKSVGGSNPFDSTKTAGGGKKGVGLADSVKQNYQDYLTQEKIMLQQSFDASNKAYQDALTKQQSDKIKIFIDSDKQIQDAIAAERKKHNNLLPVKSQDALSELVYNKAIQDKVLPAGQMTEQLAKQGIAGTSSGISMPIKFGDDPSLAYRTAMANAKADQEVKEKAAQESLKTSLAAIATQTAANDTMYKAGSISEKQYYATKASLERATYAAQISHAAAILAAQEKELQMEVKLQNIDSTTAAKKSIGFKSTAATSVIDAQAALQKGLDDISKQKAVEDNQAQIKNIQMSLQVKKDELSQELDAVENNYKEQLLSAKDYEAAKTQLVMDGIAAEKDAAEQTLDAQKDSAADRLATLQKYQQSLMIALKTLQKYNEESAPNQAKDISQNYNNQITTMQSRLQIASQFGTGAGATVGNPVDIINQMKQATQDQIQQYQTLIKTVEPLSSTWYDIYGNILKATQQLTQYNQQARDAQSILPAAGGTLSEISQQMSGVFGSHFARGLETSIGGIGQEFQDLPKLNDVLNRNKDTAYDPATQKLVDAANASGSTLTKSATDTSQTFSSMSSNVKTASDYLAQQLTMLAAKISGLMGGGSSSLPTLGSSSGSSPQATLANIKTEGGPNSDEGQDMETSTSSSSATLGGGGIFGIFSKLLGPTGFSGLSKVTTQLVSSFGGLFNTIEHSGSASSGALAGGLGGAGLGQSLGSAAGQAGGPLSSLGAAAGPAGAAAGAGIGIIMGMISGQKQETVTDDINKIQITFKNVMSDYSSNNQSLKQTIENIQSLISQAQADMANSKKGSSQFADLINQYNTQIQQLQDQAAQTMTQLKEQLDILSSPTPYQDMVSSIESVIQQYAQFVGAAQNTQQLAQANQFLSQSLQQLAEGYSEQLLQDQQTAVQDALQLNSLYNQRNQLQYQFLQQTESIMGQGTITRNQTAAQSKYAQLYQASVSYSNQMMDLNEQISVEQYKVQAEAHIFQLATTRQGLESQIASLQMESTNLDMARIAAMSQLLATLKSTGYSITNLGGINTSNPNSLITTLMSLLLGQLGNSSTSNMSNLISQISAAMNGSTNTSTSGVAPGVGLKGTAASTYATLAGMGLGGFDGTNL